MNPKISRIISIVWWKGVDYVARIVAFFYFLNFRKYHVTLVQNGWKFKITSVLHEDHIAAMQERLDKMALELKPEEFIRSALTEALDGGNFIIFSPKEKELKFVQFWVGNGRIELDFPITKLNKYEKYYLALLGLIKYYELENEEFEKKNKLHYQDMFKQKEIHANLGRNVELATDMTMRIYK